MEIAITIPNDVLQRAEEMARSLGISLNELYAQALNHFLESHGESEITRKTSSHRFSIYFESPKGNSEQSVSWVSGSNSSST